MLYNIGSEGFLKMSGKKDFTSRRIVNPMFYLLSYSDIW